MSLRPKFWEQVPLKEMTAPEWEALCDGCGQCCLNKLEEEDTGDVYLTRVACRLFDDASCRCRHYETRRDHVPECISLTPKTIDKHAYWLPKTCAYLRLYEGDALPDWHPLLTGDANSVHDAGVSMQGLTVSEDDVSEEDWENHLIESPSI